MSHLQGAKNSYPHHEPFPSPEEHWQAILRYDAARRQSSEVGNLVKEEERQMTLTKEIQKSTTLNKPNKRKVKRMSIGDDLPHMPEEEKRLRDSKLISQNARFDNNSKQESLPQKSAAKYADALKTIDDPFEGYNRDLTLGREITPPAFKGENSTMVNRELQRLREQKPRKIQRRWRIITGSMMLLVFSFTTYIFVQNLRSYLSLSPSNWILSDSTSGSNITPDPLLRTLALINTIASGFALLGILASGFYLRLTRRRSCGSGLIWFAAILCTTINLLLSVTNLGLIAGWHNQFSNQSTNPLAQFRDVGQRCQGTWNMDLLWDAANSKSQGCQLNPKQTVQAYMIAGASRLIVFVLLCSIWLICLRNYNQVQRQDLTSNDSIDESPEMHQLLNDRIEHGGLPEMPTLQSMPGKYYDEDIDSIAIYEEEKNNFTQKRDSYSTLNTNNNNNLYQSNSTLVGSAPTIEKFNWQRQVFDQNHQEEITTYGNLPKHERDQSAGAWSTHIMDRLYHALWGSNHEQRESSSHNNNNEFQSVSIHEESLPWQHGREGTRLGVRGWFGRDISGAHSRVSEDEGYEESEKVPTISSSHHEFNPPNVPNVHKRTSSQENRANQDRHEASRRAYERNNDDDRYTSSDGLGSRSLSRKAAHERSLRKKQEQRDRIEFLASLGHGEDENQNRNKDQKSLPLPPPLPSKQQKPTKSRSSTSSNNPSIHTTLSNGEKLPHMPALQSAPVVQSVKQTEIDRLEEEDVVDESIFWRSPGGMLNSSEEEKKSGPIFVRQLGKLVRQLSAIESVGSGGERSQPYSPNSREPSTASGIF